MFLLGLLNAIPAKLIAGAVAALVLLAIVWGGYHYVSRLQERVIQAEASLATEKQARISAEETLDQFKRKVALNQEQLRDLEAANIKSQDNWVATLKLIDSLNDCIDVPDAIQSPGNDPAAPFVPLNAPDTPKKKTAHETASSLNSTNAAVNRMLERIGR